MSLHKLVIPLSQNDIEELMNGETFDWTFKTSLGMKIDVHLRPETEEDIEGDIE
jgi:hypothetical protein